MLPALCALQFCLTASWLSNGPVGCGTYAATLTVVQDALCCDWLKEVFALTGHGTYTESSIQKLMLWQECVGTTFM